MRRRLAAVLALLAVAAPAPVGAATAAPSPTPTALCPATDTSSACEQKRALDAVRQRLAASVAAGEAAQVQLRRSIEDNRRQQAGLRARVAEAEHALGILDGEIQRAQAEIARLEARIAVEQAQIRALARAIYFQPRSVLLLVASAGSLAGAVAGAYDLMAAGSRASAVERSIVEARAGVVSARSRAERDRAEQARLRDSIGADLARLGELEGQQVDAAWQLARKIAQTRAEADAAERQSAGLAARIAAQLQAEQDRIIADAMQRAWAQALLWIAANPGQPGVSAGHSRRYRFVWPEPQGQVTQGYGPTDLALEPAYAGFAHFHAGIDVAAPEGTPVLAADDGLVAAVGDGTTGYGRYVVLTHRDGLLTLYGHLLVAGVKVGDAVTQGQPVGLEGSTGNSTGPHVHFELRSGGQPQDPTPLLPPAPPSAYRG